mmetsp:Transcript_38548/g.92586  ORF Transcript_38548/g.92586 Transcript_38548/m.92586 type:complete len:132 (+) Transcript_38548:12-407(+)
MTSAEVIRRVPARTPRETGSLLPPCIVDCILESRMSTPTLKPPRESIILRRRAESAELGISLASEIISETGIVRDTTISEGGAGAAEAAGLDTVDAVDASDGANVSDATHAPAGGATVHLASVSCQAANKK